jgi:hypothetical protein
MEDRDLITALEKIVYLAGGEVDKTSFSLRFFGDALDPGESSRTSIILICFVGYIRFFP